MALDIKALRAKLKDETQKQQVSSGGDNASYKFWNMDDDSKAIIRLLQDGNPDNQYLWAERNMINLEFAGVVGGSTNPIKVQVPCMHMYGETCPIITEASKFYKDGRDELGSKYWKKKSFLYQGFVRKSPFEEENVPENPIRRFVLNPNLHQIVYSFIMDDDNDVLPTDYERGSDFQIMKTNNGKYSSYNTSSFSRKETALTDDELAAIEKYGLFNLSDFLPNKPDAETLAVIVEMFEASLDGDAYDPARFGKYYKPYGLELNTNETSNSSEKSDEAIVSKKEEPKAQPSTNEEAGEKPRQSADELLARIRANRS